jgi:rhodanese-related sulfurtransferase
MDMKNLLRAFTPEFLAKNQYKISATEALTLTAIILLDIRSADEEECMSIAEDLQHYPGIKYQHIPMNELPDRLDELPLEKEILVFCRTTNRSAMVYAFLRTQGFECVRLVEGGYVALVKFLVAAHGI